MNHQAMLPYDHLSDIILTFDPCYSTDNDSWIESLEEHNSLVIDISDLNFWNWYFGGSEEWTSLHSCDCALDKVDSICAPFDHYDFDKDEFWMRVAAMDAVETRNHLAHGLAKQLGEPIFWLYKNLMGHHPQACKPYASYCPRFVKSVHVNAKNSSGFTALDVVEHMPPGEIKSEIYNILHQSGGLRAKDLANRSYNSFNNTKDGFHTIRNTKPILFLLITTLLVFLGGVRVFKQPNSTTIRLFIIFNSFVLTALVAVLMFLIRDFPFKPWPQIYLLTLFGSYVCSISMVSPFSTEAWVLLFIGIPFLLLAAAGKLFGLERKCVSFESLPRDEGDV